MQTSLNRPLKIVHVASHNVVRAGGSIQMMRLALGLKERGHDVWCAFNIRKGDSPPGLGTFEPLQEADIKVFSFPMQRIRKYRGMLAFRKFLSSHNFDIVHTHRFRALNFVCNATRGMKTPVILGNKKNSFSIPPSWARVYASSKVDSIVVNADCITDLFVKTGRVDPAKVVNIYNGVDLNAFSPDIDGSTVRESLGIAPDVPLFGMVANFARKKSHDIFFEAALQALKEMPRAMFLLVGDGDYERYRPGLSRSGFGDHFLFTGFRTDIPRILAALDFSVISSKEGEGLTGSLVESMVMAKPVISTDVAGNADVVKNKDTGMLVPAGRADMMAEAMVYFLRNPREAAEMGRRARSFVKDKVDNTKRTLRFEQLYTELLQKKGGAAQ